MAVPPPSKSVLRAERRERRQRYVDGLDVAARAEAARALADRVVWREAGHLVVAAYVAIDAEIDTAPLIAALAATGVTIALPHVTGRTDTPRFLRWAPGDALEEGVFGLRQPAAASEALAPDLILTPLLGFDRQLNRIGYGAGHFDRAFALYPAARRVGLAWAVQECPLVPHDPWDVPLHAVATETEWITI